MDGGESTERPLRLRRRRFLSLTAGGLGVTAAGAVGWSLSREPHAVADPSADSATASTDVSVAAMAAPASTPAASTPTPIPEPPVLPRGREELRLMTDTEWEADGVVFHSGVAGPRVMVLGGVHGNEPGSWLAAEQVAKWEVVRGALIVLPRINWRSAAAFERTIDGFGDLNRLYPGHPDGLPMARMAAEITALVEYWRPNWLWDMHESWGFFNERGENGGTAFIGQTVATADSLGQMVVEQLAARFNMQVTEREHLVTRFRAGGRFGGQGGQGSSSPSPEAEAGRTLPDGRRGSSSLSLGQIVAGVRPVLIEMGQMNQPEARRSELHQLLLRELLVDLQMLEQTVPR